MVSNIIIGRSRAPFFPVTAFVKRMTCPSPRGCIRLVLRGDLRQATLQIRYIVATVSNTTAMTKPMST